MLTIDDAFRKFKSRLELNDREQANASARHTEVREFLRTKFLGARRVHLIALRSQTRTRAN